MPPALFAYYFSDKILSFGLGLASEHDAPTYASYIAGIIDMKFYAQLIC
jgi:hypothetical protein